MTTRTTDISINIVKTDDAAYSAFFAPFPGILGHGCTPWSASDDLLDHFFAGFDDLTTLAEDCIWEGATVFEMQIHQRN